MIYASSNYVAFYLRDAYAFLCFSIYSTSISKMDTTLDLPSRKNFFSSISEKTISKEDYKFAQNVWKKFKVKSLTEYCQLYCGIDVLVLAEIMQKFRSTMMKFASLDPVHYVSLAGFGWDTMLKLTQCNIELPINIDQIKLVQSGIRGGISFINTRYKSVKNKTNDENTKRVRGDIDKGAIKYIDANNLYGQAQLGKLPYSNFKWIPEYHLNNFKVSKIDLESDIGYILEVDLIYPSDLHFYHNDYPLCPETMEITKKDLSEYSIKCCDNFKNYKSKKLITSFKKKENYVVHIKNLKLYLELGMKLTKIHRVLQFVQKSFLTPFIEKCTEERKKTNSIFEKNLFKLMANSVFGKSIENCKDYITIKMHKSDESFRKASSLHTFKNFSIIDDDLVTTSHFLPQIFHDKPYAIGFTILEYSKHFMYDFYYNKLLKKCGKENVELLFTDTDSFCLYVKDEHLFNVQMSEFMDYSNYNTDHPFFDESKKSSLGFFKDEIDGNSKCVEYVGLRSKCYALKIKNNISNDYTIKKIAKGLGKVAIQNRLKFKEYKKCLFKQKDIRHHYTGIVSQKHNLYTVIRNKKALSCFDSKRYILPCGIHSYPLSSYLIEKFKGKCHKCSSRKKIKTFFSSV